MKYCTVPYCNSSSENTPNKLFIMVPLRVENRRKWFKLAGRKDAHKISATVPMYFCEDHFDLQKDMVNYMQYHVMGSVSRIVMKKDCMPTRFDCQTQIDGKQNDSKNLNSSDMVISDTATVNKAQDQSCSIDILNIDKEIKKEIAIEEENSENNLNIKQSVEENVTKIIKLEYNSDSETINDEHYLNNVITIDKPEQELIEISKNPFECTICEKLCDDDESLVEHLESHNRFKCVVCGKFVSKCSLKGHMMNHAGERPHKCTICEKSFFLKLHLERHMKTHIDEKPYECTICEKSFKVLGYLRHHMSVHTGRSPHRCVVCEQSFARKSFLKEHIMTVHIEEKLHDLYNCVICQESFLTRELLLKHMLLHNDKKIYKCEVCEKSFSLKADLTQHIITHDETRWHKCTVCDKSFQKKKNLKQHLKIHSEENPFQCAVCDASFKSCGVLLKHLKSHTNGNMLQCNICKKTFQRSNNLKTHVKRHMFKSFLDQHMKIHETIQENLDTETPNEDVCLRRFLESSVTIEEVKQEENSDVHEN